MFLKFSNILYHTHSVNVKIGYVIVRENKTVVGNVLNVKGISSSKCVATSTKPQGVTSEKTVIFIVALKYMSVSRTQEVGVSVSVSGRTLLMNESSTQRNY
jgi:hypothetical protein